MDNGGGLICSYVLDGKGGGQEISRSELGTKRFSGCLLWVHMDREGAEGRRWLDDESGLDPFICEALLEDAEMSTERWISEGRPRTIVFEDGVIINLRGANLNPGASPNDMVVVRLWVNPERVVSVRRRHSMATDYIRTSIADGKGPRGPSDFILTFAERLLDLMRPVLADFQMRIDNLEEVVITGRSTELRSQLRGLRREAIAWKRHIAPQEEALTSLMTSEVPWLKEHDRARLGELIHDIARHVEDLDGVRERATIIQDEISNQLSEEMNRTMYHLSIIAAVFLPLGFITGLLGMNLVGVPIPGSDTPWAFFAVCILLALIGGIAVLIFRRMKWL